MRLALDTNRYVDFMRADPAAFAMLRRATSIAVPLVVVAELRAGFRSGTKGSENESRLASFLSVRRVHVLSPDEGTTHLYARVFSDLRRKGAPIPTNDLWIAALALQHDLPLYTRDEHFRSVDGLALV